ncbi:MAG: DNA starvation/stationary phase protection protein [bacterium]
MKSVILNNVNVEVSELMKEILADQFVLYTKARNYHWNVTGPQFYGLHAAFENIYDGLADDIDSIAERIRVLGVKAPGTMAEFLELSSLKEVPGEHPEQFVMVQNILDDFEVIIGKLDAAAHKMLSELSDEVSAGMLYSLVEKYQKTVWMLKSTLGK